MPLRTVAIDCALPSYFGAASFLAVLAYPKDRKAGEKFRDQLCVACFQHLRSKAKRDVVVEAPLDIFLSKPEPKFFDQSVEYLYDRFGIGFHVVLRQADLLDVSDYYSSGTKEALGQLIDDWGWQNPGDASVSTAQTKIWKPAWPVFHAAAAFAHAGILHTYGISKRLLTINFRDFSSPAFKDLVFALMMKNGIEKQLVMFAEEVRSRMLEKGIYKKISESNTIEFALINESDDKDGFASASKNAPRIQGDWTP